MARNRGKGLVPHKSAGALAKPGGSLEKMLAQYVSDDVARETAGGGGPNLSIRGGRFTLGGEVLGTELDVVVLEFVHTKNFYDAGFDPDDRRPPACFALSEDGKDLAPHESSPDPQNEACDGCPHNVFGTADKGRGKACKDGRKLALIHVDDLEDIENATIAVLSIPPTSLTPWAGYLKGLANRLGRPVFSVVTRLTFDADSEFPKLIPTVVKELNDKKLLNALVAKRDGLRQTLMTPPDVSGYTAPGSGGGAKRGGKAKPERAPRGRAKDAPAPRTASRGAAGGRRGGAAPAPAAGRRGAPAAASAASPKKSKFGR